MGCQTSTPTAQAVKLKYRFSSQLLNRPQNNPESSPGRGESKKEAIIDGSIEYYQKFIEADPYFQHPFDGLGCIEESIGHFEGKIEEWYRENRQKGKFLGNPYDALSLCYLLKETTEQAEKWYQKMIAKEPDVYQLHFGLGNVYYRKKQFEKAEEKYKKVLEINPRVDRAYTSIAFIYCYHLYENTQAAEWSSFALPLNKRNEHAFLVRQIVRENLSERIDNLTKLAKLFPKYARIYNALGLSYIELYRYPSAINCFLKGIQVNPNYYALYYGLALAYNRSGKVESAIRLSQTSLKKNPSHHEPYTNLGQAYYNKGDWKQAEKWYKKCIKVNPSFITAYSELTNIYLRQQRKQEAEKLLEQAYKIGDKSVQILYLLGKMKIDKGEDKIGLFMLQKTLSIQYSHPESIQFLNIYLRQDDKDDEQIPIQTIHSRLASRLSIFVELKKSENEFMNERSSILIK